MSKHIPSGITIPSSLFSFDVQSVLTQTKKNVKSLDSFTSKSIHLKNDNDSNDTTDSDNNDTYNQ